MAVPQKGSCDDRKAKKDKGSEVRAVVETGKIILRRFI
jgi:hypothetical protein